MTLGLFARRWLHRPQLENQESVATWADKTFGPTQSLARIAARANEEMAELLRITTAAPVNPQAAIDEAADVVIVLYRLARNAGGDLLDAVDRKMAVNRGRAWKLDATGHGYHVREGR